ncbi:MAG: DUF86 domain-containing protein [Candidatus Lokiarchaeota archaeon]
MNRIEQYKRKFNFIIDKIMVLPENVKEEVFLRDALFYRLQVSIDAAMDVIAMLSKDLGVTVKDDYSNIDELKSFNIFPKQLLNDLTYLNRVRNTLVHKYNKIEDDQIIKEKDHYVDVLKLFVKLAEEIVNERLKLSK